jgi:hypothetical protein
VITNKDGMDTTSSGGAKDKICLSVLIRKFSTEVSTGSSGIKGKAVSTVTGLEWPRGFQEVKVPRFHDNATGWW